MYSGQLMTLKKIETNNKPELSKQLKYYEIDMFADFLKLRKSGAKFNSQGNAQKQSCLIKTKKTKR